MAFGREKVRRVHRLFQLLDFLLGRFQTQFVRLQFDLEDAVLLRQRIDSLGEMFATHLALVGIGARRVGNG